MASPAALGAHSEGHQRLDGAAVARGVTATSAGGGWVAELWADGETGPELHVQEWREARKTCS